MIDSQGNEIFDKRAHRNLLSDVKILKVFKSRVDCKTLDGLIVKNIPVLFQSSHSFERPKVGDIGVLLAPSGDVERGVIIGFKHLEKDEAEESIGQSVTFEDGTKVLYDDETSTMRIDGNKELSIVCHVKSLNITASSKGEINLDVKEAEKMNNNGVVTGACPCIVTGTNHAFTSKKVKAGL